VAAIYVDETNVPALALYESNGFHHHHVDVCYSRPACSAEAALPVKIQITDEAAA
jgi:hypothetical protein